MWIHKRHNLNPLIVYLSSQNLNYSYQPELILDCYIFFLANRGAGNYPRNILNKTRYKKDEKGGLKQKPSRFTNLKQGSPSLFLTKSSKRFIWTFSHQKVLWTEKPKFANLWAQRFHSMYIWDTINCILLMTCRQLTL